MEVSTEDVQNTHPPSALLSLSRHRSVAMRHEEVEESRVEHTRKGVTSRAGLVGSVELAGARVSKVSRVSKLSRAHARESPAKSGPDRVSRINRFSRVSRVRLS